jgi:hypothetical protein
VIGTLVERGFTVSAGILRHGSYAAAVAGELDVEVVTAPPFEPISDTTRARANALAERAAVTVVTDPEIFDRDERCDVVASSGRCIVVGTASDGSDLGFRGAGDLQVSFRRVDSLANLVPVIEESVDA